MQPLAIDLFCGLGGWTEGLLAEGYRVVGFDIEQHVYGEDRYPAQLVVQDVLTLHGSQFRTASLIVASPPCQEYSYMAMPWSLAKAKAAAIRADETGAKLADLNRLFNACFRIQKEACDAAGRHIPMVVENVRGAQPWVGKARWNYGSFYLWGDVPALMPMTFKASKVPGFRFDGNGGSFQSASVERHALEGVKRAGRTMCFPAGSSCPEKVSGRTGKLHWVDDGVKGSEGYERNHPAAFGWKKPGTSSKSSARKAASAMIAKIPLPLSRHIAATFRTQSEGLAA